MSDTPDLSANEPAEAATAGPAYPNVKIGDGLPWALPAAIVWAIVAFIAGFYFVFGVKAEVYGGDAYTGIEGAIVTATKAIGWLIVASGVLAVLLAGRRYSR